KGKSSMLSEGRQEFQMRAYSGQLAMWCSVTARSSDRNAASSRGPYGDRSRSALMLRLRSRETAERIRGSRDERGCSSSGSNDLVRWSPNVVQQPSLLCHKLAHRTGTSQLPGLRRDQV